MKSQIIQLEIHDDVISIKDKLGWARASRIILVVPKRSNLLRQKIDLTILKRHSQKLGIQLALITDDPLTRSLANEAGISTFSTISQAYKKSWIGIRKRKRQNDDTGLYHERFYNLQRMIQASRSNPPPSFVASFGRLCSFFLGVLAVLFLASALFPSAIVIYKPLEQRQNLSLTMTASSKIAQPRASGEFPISFVSNSLQTTKSIKTTGSMNIPVEFAHGEVEFTNLTDQQIKIPKGLVVRTNQTQPHRYQTTIEGVLPPGSGSKMVIPVQAILPGSSENLPPKSIQAVEGLYGLKVAVINPAEITGGIDKKVSAPSQNDLQELYRLTYQELLERANTQAVTLLQPGDILLSENPYQVKIIQKEYQPPPNSPADRIELTLEIEAIYPVVSSDHIKTIGINLLDASLPPDFVPDNQTFNASCEQLPKSINGNYSCLLKISRSIQPKINVEILRKTIAGKKIDWSKNYLKHALLLETPPEIKVTPSWFPILPFIPFRIEFTS